MLFVFQGVGWGALTLALAVAALLYSYRAFGSGAPAFGTGGLVIALLLLYSTLFSLHARRRVEILGDLRVVRYTNETLQRRASWEKAFSEFEAVILTRALKRGIRNLSGFAVLLRTRDQEHLLLGTNASGWTTYSKASALAHRVAQLMGLSLP